MQGLDLLFKNCFRLEAVSKVEKALSQDLSA